MWPTSFDAYTNLAEIGRGGTSRVFRATCIKDGDEQLVAIKVFDLSDTPTQVLEEIRAEIRVMSLLQHPNIVQFYTSFTYGTQMWCIMEHMSAGSCSDAIRKLGPINDEIVIASILKKVLEGLQYFHKTGHIHRDIKSANILLTVSGNVKLADFGVSGAMIQNGRGVTVRNSLVGTPCWMAPEVLASEGHTFSADIWSVGITAYELAIGNPPLAGCSAMKVLVKTLQDPAPTLPREFSGKFKKFMGKCLVKEARKRSNCVDLLKTAFVSLAKDSEYIKVHLIDKLQVQPAPINAAKMDDLAKLVTKGRPVSPNQ